MRLTVQTRIWGMLALFMLGMIAMAGLHVWSGRSAMLAEKKLKTQHLVQGAISVLRHYHALEQNHRLSRDAAQAAAQQTIRDMRYGNGDYFWIQDAREPVMIMHPVMASLIGQRLDTPLFDRATSIQSGVDGPVELTDGKANMGVAFNRVANDAGGGFITYAWPKRAQSGGDASELHPKLSYVEKFAPWNWVVGSGIYIDDVDAATRLDALHYFWLISLGGGLLAFLSILLASSVIRPLKQATRRLTAMSKGSEPLGPLPIWHDDEIGALIAGYNRLQAALCEREASLQLAASVVDNALEGIVVTDTERRVISANAAFFGLTGLAEGEVLGARLDSLCDVGVPAETLAGICQLLRQGVSWEGEWQLVRRSPAGALATHASIVPVTGAGGRISHYIGVFQDVSEQVRLTEQLRLQAHTDSLTGLSNRGHFLELAMREMGRLKRYDAPLSLAVLDLDHFKRVNDRYGHAAGDEVLKCFAAICRKVLRDSDIVGRVGGEEFAILFPHSDGQVALQIAERLRETIAGTSLAVEAGEALHFSISLGIAERQPGEESLDGMFKRADAALYRAKEEGRNRSCLAESPGAAVFSGPPG